MSHYRDNKSVTLFELIIAISLLAMVVLAISSIDLFGRYHLTAAQKRAQIQNEVSFAMEHISKNVLQGTGSFNYKPLQQLASDDGFRVRVDCNNPVTPSRLSDDKWVSYFLSGNSLSYTESCTACTCSLNNETLSNHIFEGVKFERMPDPMPDPPEAGFYIYFTDNDTAVEIGLVACWDPAGGVPTAYGTPNPCGTPDNPQVVMKTKLYCRSSSTH